jgi:hypothetical protein
VKKPKRSHFGEPMTPGLALSVEIVRFIYWQGRLIVVFVIEAAYLTNHSNLSFTLVVSEKVSR